MKQSKYEDLMKEKRSDLALDVIRLERKVIMAQDTLNRVSHVIERTADAIEDIPDVELKDPGPIADFLLDGLTMVKGLTEEISWDLPFERDAT